MKSIAWAVRLRGKEIDTVFFDEDMEAGDVLRSLIGHDGYDPAITVNPSRPPVKLVVAPQA